MFFYAKKDITVQQSKDYSFIKFGSSVDIFLPLDAKVKGIQDIIAEL